MTDQSRRVTHACSLHQISYSANQKGVFYETRELILTCHFTIHFTIQVSVSSSPAKQNVFCFAGDVPDLGYSHAHFSFFFHFKMQSMTYLAVPLCTF